MVVVDRGTKLEDRVVFVGLEEYCWDRKRVWPVEEEEEEGWFRHC